MKTPGKWWKRQPEKDRTINGIETEAWRHFWTGSVFWFKKGSY